MVLLNRIFRVAFGIVALWVVSGLSSAPQEYIASASQAPFHLPTAATCPLLLGASEPVNSPKYSPIKAFFRRGIQYEERTGRVEFGDGTLIEGSLNHGGIQPHYQIQRDDPLVNRFLQSAATAAAAKDTIWEKINAVRDRLNEAFPRKNYDDPTYQSMVRDIRRRDQTIGLGDYLDRGCGVCREHAIVMHLALQEIGLKPQIVYVQIWRTRLGKRITEDHGINLLEIAGETWVVDSYFSPFHGKRFEDLKKPNGVSFRFGRWTGNTPDADGPERARILSELAYPTFLVPIGKHPIESIEVSLADHSKLDLTIQKRSSVERRFKQEQLEIDSADVDSSVPIEWLFHPFYFPFGHTSIRMGTRIYEFTKNGWEIHETGGDNARAFLFNNPFFKRQYKKYEDQGMPPISIGIPIRISKSASIAFDAGVRRYPMQDGRPFSLFFNNCNQRVLATLKAAGVDIAMAGFYPRFSSVLTFQQVLKAASIETEPPVIYPLSGLRPETFESENLIPEHLFTTASAWDEVLRVLESLVGRWLSGSQAPPFGVALPQAETAGSP